MIPREAFSITNPRNNDIHSLLDREIVLERFPPPRRGALPVFIGYPAPYRIGMSNLGFHFLFGRLRCVPDFRVERFFLDTAPVTLEGGSQISSAPVLLFSVSYEEDYLSLVRILLRSGIEPLRRRRNRRPIVIAGGPAVSANPFPLSGIVDAVALGEGEGPLGRIIDCIRRRGLEREALIGAMASIPGIMVPGVPGGGSAYAPDADAEEFPRSVIVTSETVFADTLLIETGRGCPGSCSFCLATALYRPYRALPVGVFERYLESVPPEVRKVGLVSTAVAAHPDFGEMIERLSSRGLGVSFSSLRAEDLDRQKVRLLRMVGTQSVSLAPETGSERLRFKLGKRITDETYYHVAALLTGAGIKRITLYLLAGCPGEDESTVQETARFLADFKKAAGGRSYSVHINTLVPKAWTPFQFHAVPGRDELARRFESLRTICRGLGLSFKVKSVRSSLRQALLSLAGEEVGPALVAVAAGGVSWRKALRDAGIEPTCIHEPKEEGFVFPWDELEGPTKKGYCFVKYRQAVDG
ncbi:MAG: radical SAM protein [bacterium]|nr:MAG: radical SAM protein [bacterium]